MSKNTKSTLEKHEYHSGSGSLQINGMVQDFKNLTLNDFMLRPQNPDKPSFKVTKFPVFMPEYEKLKAQVKKPDNRTKLPVKEKDPSAGQPDETNAISLENPTDGMIMANMPGSLAPGILASFDALPTTSWRPPDCTIAVGSGDDVVTGVNVDMAGYSKKG